MLDELVERLETTPAGPFLARLVASVDRAALDGSGALALAEARARLIAHEQAQFLADLAEVGLVDWHTPPGVVARMAAPDEFSVDRIAWTLHWSREAAHAHLLLASDLLHRLPTVYESLVAGRLDLARARVFHDALLGVDVEVATAVVATLIEQAPTWTCGRLRERLRYHLHKADPDHAARRYRQAVTGRQVRAGTNHEGTGFLSGQDLPIERAAAADAYLDLLTGIAFTVHPSRDPITHTADTDAADCESLVDSRDDAVEARRLVPASAVHDPQTHLGVATIHGTPDTATRGADPATGVAAPAAAAPPDARVCCRCGGVRPADRRGIVHLSMSLPTLLGLTNDPALIPGWGPVLAEIARHVALDQTHPTTWQYGITDQHGRLLHTGPIRRRPRAGDLRHVRMRDQTCRAPNCRRPATACDTDHRHAYASGGPTHPDNLEPLCRHHHRLKHHKNLHLRHHNDGSYQWKAPNGETWHVPAEWASP
jgi:hypothetical protein